MSLTLDLHTPGRSWLHQLDPRVKLVGLGEGVGDLVDFDPDEFVDALFE